jgi:hypothetical protein
VQKDVLELDQPFRQPGTVNRTKSSGLEKTSPIRRQPDSQPPADQTAGLFQKPNTWSEG